MIPNYEKLNTPIYRNVQMIDVQNTVYHVISLVIIIFANKTKYTVLRRTTYINM